MTEIEKSLSTQKPSSGLTSAMDDEAFLMTMVEADESLLPSNMTFTGLFEGDNELNPEELSDIAILLAPQVSDDDEMGGSVSSSSETNTPVSVRTNTAVAAAAAAAAASGKIPILPQLGEETLNLSAAVVSPTGSQKRSFVLQDSADANPTKKTKLATRKIVLKPKSAAPSIPLFENANATTSTPAENTGLPTLAPKPAAAVTKKSTTTSPAAPSNKPPSETTTTQEAVDASPDATAVAAQPAATGTKPAAPKALTEEERAQQSRDRNRTHARNTRLRKKAYVEELKRQLRDMVEQRDATVLEETQKAKIVEQQREVRFQVMQDFLQLRGRNEGNPQRWGAILEEGFSLTVPKTSFQTMVDPAIGGTTEAALVQLLDGVPTIMEDSTYFASFLQTLGNNHTHSAGDDAYIPVTTTFVYECERSSFLMDGANAIMNWSAHSKGAVQAGARRELELCGSMRASFCDQTNRMEKAEIRFDTGLVHSQLSA